MIALHRFDASGQHFGGAFDIATVVGGADEASLVGGWRQIDTVIHCIVEELVKLLRIAADRVVVVANWILAEKQGKH